MGKTTGIEWTDNTWNPFRGCLKISPGCKQCYMYRDQVRYGRDPRAVVRAADPTFYMPLKWRGPAKVFTCSWSDWFIDEADAWRSDAWDVIRQTPHLTYQILTKRPENISERLPHDWGNGWPNVWLGVSVENAEYTWRLDELLTIPAAVHFVSYEPALGPVDFTPWMRCELVSGEPKLYPQGVYTPARIRPRIGWLISGGESGSRPRPADLDWFRQVRDDCQRFDVAYFHKQHGGRNHMNGSWGGRELDGRTWDEFPQTEVAA